MYNKNNHDARAHHPELSSVRMHTGMSRRRLSWEVLERRAITTPNYNICCYSSVTMRPSTSGPILRARAALVGHIGLAAHCELFFEA